MIIQQLFTEGKWLKVILFLVLLLIWLIGVDLFSLWYVKTFHSGPAQTPLVAFRLTGQHPYDIFGTKYVRSALGVHKLFEQLCRLDYFYLSFATPSPTRSTPEPAKIWRREVEGVEIWRREVDGVALALATKGPRVALKEGPGVALRCNEDRSGGGEPSEPPMAASVGCFWKTGSRSGGKRVAIVGR